MKMRSEKEMLDLIIGTARDDERIRGVIMSGSRADTHAPRDIYQDYDIMYFVDDVAPFWNNTAWLEEKFGRIAVLQTPEIMGLIPPDNDGSFVFLTIFEDGNRIDLNITADPYVDDGEPVIVLLDKTGELSGVNPRDDFWYIKPPIEKLFHDCCNEFWWCLNNVAKGIARDELPYVRAMFDHHVRDMLNYMTDWYIGAANDFRVSAGKMGKYYKKYLPEELYRMYAATYSDSDYDNIWSAVFTACELFRKLAGAVADKFGYTYNLTEDRNMTDYMNKVRSNALGG